MRRELLAMFRAMTALGIIVTVTACGGSAPGSTGPAATPTSSVLATASAAMSATPAPSAPAASPSGPTTSPSGSTGSIAGSCGVLTAAEIQQFAGIAVTGTQDLGGACAYLSASGIHSATKDVRYLAGKDGVIIGAVPGATTSSTCPTRPVQGAPTTANVCNVPGPEVLALFKAASGASVELNVFSSATLTDAQIDGLIAASYGRL
jgi:hypothetical protein